ncbi:hypothetical protein D3C83_73740 [compost metagenome]
MRMRRVGSAWVGPSTRPAHIPRAMPIAIRGNPAQLPAGAAYGSRAFVALTSSVSVVGFAVDSSSSAAIRAW